MRNETILKAHLSLVRLIHRQNRNISNSSKFTTIVELKVQISVSVLISCVQKRGTYMLVFQAKEIPNKSSKNFQKS